MNFKNIPVCYQPTYTWLWNTTITKKEIECQIDEMYNSGIRAFYVLAEPENFRPYIRKTHLFPEYLSEEYLDLLVFAFEKAKEKGMYTWAYNEGGFPSGMVCGKIREINPSLADKSIAVNRMILTANTPYKFPERLISAFVDGRRIKENESFPADTEITEFTVWYNDSLLTDIGDKENTELFLELTHEKLKEKFGEYMGTDIKLMFDDEPHIGGWTKNLDILFKKRYGYDIGDFMPVIACTKAPKNILEHRALSDYNMLCGEIVKENYFSKAKEWLNKNNMLSCGHLDRDNTSEMPFLKHYGNVLSILREYDVPGIDVIWRQIGYPKNGKCCTEGYEFFPLIVSSAARHQGHNTALSESFAVCGADITPDEMRFDINFQAVRGISLFNFMTISFARIGAMPLQYRPNFINENPGMDTLKEINDYTARLSYIIGNGRAEINTALYFPQRSICGGGAVKKKAISSFENIGHILEKTGINFDIIDEEIVRSASVDKGVLKCKFTSYENVFIPDGELEYADVIEKLHQTGKEYTPCFKRSNTAVLARKLSFADGSKGYFICNTDRYSYNDSVTLFTDQYPYKVDLITGEIYKIPYKKQKDGVDIDVSLVSGEGIFILLTEEKLNVLDSYKTETACELNDFVSFINRKYEIDHEIGMKNTFFECGEETKGLYVWDEKFSGEVTYKTELPPLSDGNYLLDLGEVRYSAKVYINGKKIGEKTLSPYILPLPEIKSGDELKITIANTSANALNNTEFFEKQDILDIGPYHAKMKEFEAKVLCGGLLGPVKILKIL